MLDRTKDPAAVGEPLYQDVVTALAEQMDSPPRVIGGRYGLASKEFTPAMAAAVYAELASDAPRRHFTVGIRDDVSDTSLEYDPSFRTEPDGVVRAVFFGLGSDGTVGANKNSVKIIAEQTGLHAQGYFVYDSKKSGSTTVSHLRFGPEPIRSTYLIDRAGFVACHQFDLLHRMDVLGVAEEGATFLLNSRYGPDEVWEHLPGRRPGADRPTSSSASTSSTRSKVARDAGLGARVNTVLQPCFFALADVLPRDEAIEAIKDAIRATYGKRGELVVERNFAAVDLALASMHEVEVPATRRARPRRPPRRTACRRSSAS